MLQTYLKAKHPFTTLLQAPEREKELAAVPNRSQFKPRLRVTNCVTLSKLSNLSEPLISSSVRWDNYIYLKGLYVKCLAQNRHLASSSYCCSCCHERLLGIALCGREGPWGKGGAPEASFGRMAGPY